MNVDALRRLDRTPAAATVKGAPVLAPGTTVADLVAARPSLFGAGFLPPVMVLKDSALRANEAVMADFCRRSGVELAPHGKTHMAPQLARRQLDAGAWGMTVATPSQARVYRAFGVQRLLMANELVDPSAIAWVAAELTADPGFTFCCYVDSLEGVALLGTSLDGLPGSRPVDVLVELGLVGARTGARTVESAVDIARAAADQPRLRVVGVSGYEGGFGRGQAPEEDDIAPVREFLRMIRDSGEAIAPYVPADTPFVASAGGSVFFDVVAAELTTGWRIDRPVTVILRSGCYLTHDSGLYRRTTPFGRTLEGMLTPALEVWGMVLSRPEPGLALVNIGRRDVSFDSGMPVPQEIRPPDGPRRAAGEMTVSALNDQHAYVRFDGDPPLQVGDWMSFGISHPCSAFDKWRMIPVVDDDYHVVECVQTFF